MQRLHISVTDLGSTNTNPSRLHSASAFSPAIPLSSTTKVLSRVGVEVKLKSEAHFLTIPQASRVSAKLGSSVSSI